MSFTTTAVGAGTVDQAQAQADQAAAPPQEISPEVQAQLDQGNVAYVYNGNLAGSVPSFGIDELESHIERTLTAGNTAQTSYISQTDGAVQTRNYTKNPENGNVQMDEIKAGETHSHFTDIKTPDGDQYTAIKPNNSDTTYVYDAQTDTTYETTAKPEQLQSMIDNGAFAMANGVFTDIEGQLSYPFTESDEYIGDAVFGWSKGTPEEEAELHTPDGWEMQLDAFLESRAYDGSPIPAAS